MTTVEIALSDAQKEFVDRQVAAGGHQSASDYLLSLLREAQRKRGWEIAERLVLEGLDSGPPKAATPEFWQEKERRLSERFPDREAS
jgi:putative addiction module CopG family antidote